VNAMDDPFRRPTIVPAVFYPEPWSAREWLEKAFGYEPGMVITDKDGKIAHSEMKVGDGLIYVGSEWADYTVSPASVSGKNTQTIHVHLKNGLNAHCERASRRGRLCKQAEGPVLRRSHLFCDGPTRSCLDFWPDRPPGHPRGRGEGERPED
jgi:uncharacterized glyoxalase superfamily protein PhnB